MEASGVAFAGPVSGQLRSRVGHPASKSAFSRTFISRNDGRSTMNHASKWQMSGAVEDAAELAPPPSTFFQAVSDAQSACEEAMANGEHLLEVEFPPLPADIMESTAVGAYDVIDANIRLAVDFSKKYAKEGKKVVLVFPDRAEKDRVVERNNESDQLFENLRLGILQNESKGSFIERIWSTPVQEIAVQDDDDMYVVITASAQELPGLEQLVEKTGTKPIVLFNMKLDTSRGDLGLLGFPKKDLHFRFLCKFLPVYYLRTRTYSRSVPQAPYVVNYSGALFRVYPGDYQVLLDTTGGNYRRIKTYQERPSLGQVRDNLTDALQVSGIKSGEGALGFFRKGYTSKTWWEELVDKQESNKWRE